MTQQQSQWQNLIALLPSERRNLKRLDYLVNKASTPKIAVLGKYNHGKSSLLNAIIGEEMFTVADKRETVTNKTVSFGDLDWVDTPGLDADTKGEDDKKARNAAYQIADVLFLVHNVATGELDKHELEVYRQLMKQDKNYRQKLYLVLTQIDQLSTTECEKVITTIKAQLPELTIIPVSSLRYVKGLAQDKLAFVEQSGMSDLINQIVIIKNDIAGLRKKEIKRLKGKAQHELETLLQTEQQALASARHNRKQGRKQFVQQVNSVQQRIVKQARSLGI